MAINNTHRRDQIILAAISCFTDKGFHQTSMRDIAKQAQVSLGNLYNYFTGKEAIIEEIAVLEAQEYQKLIMLLSHQSPLKAIEELATRYFKQTCQPDNIKLTLELVAECSRNPKIAQRFAHNQNTLINALSSTIKQGIECGEIRANINENVIAPFIIYTIEGAAIRKVIFSHTSSTRKATIDLITQLLENK